MKNLATKSTHKKRNYNKKHLAQKLDNITKNVAKRGVYVVKKVNPGFHVVNYVTNKVYAENVPFVKVAKDICTTLNDKKIKDKPDSQRINKLCDKFYKHYNDIHFCTSNNNNTLDQKN